MPAPIPILEFDASPEALIEPSHRYPIRDFPARCVMGFFWRELAALGDRLGGVPLEPMQSEMPDIPVVQVMVEGIAIALVPTAVGAPMAAAQLEAAIARGGRRFVVCGGAGVLDSEIACGQLVLPTSAIREEGTSYQYLPADRPARPAPAAVEAIRATLDAHGCRYTTGPTWTTDAIYRETRGKIARRRAQGCLTVEMEAAALFAVAEFRGVTLGQILYGGDDVGGETWDSRNWNQQTSTREKLLLLAVDACRRL